jgi:hypothetical protein
VALPFKINDIAHKINSRWDFSSPGGKGSSRLRLDRIRGSYFWKRSNQTFRRRQAATMKRRCNALLLQSALGLLLVVQSVAWRGGPDAFQKDIGEYVSSLTKNYRDEDWSGNNNEDGHERFLDEVNADVGDVGESHRRLKGKKAKTAKKRKKMKAPKTPAPTSPSTGAPTCPPTRFISSPKKKSKKKSSKKKKKNSKSLAVCITPNPTAIPTASPTCSPTIQPTAAPTVAPTPRPTKKIKKQKKKKKKIKKGTKTTKGGKAKKRKRVLVSVVVFDTCQERILFFALFSNSPRSSPILNYGKRRRTRSRRRGAWAAMHQLSPRARGPRESKASMQ